MLRSHGRAPAICWRRSAGLPRPLIRVLEADPSLYRALFSLDRRRVHLIGLALAHLTDDPDPSLGRLLLGGTAVAVFDGILGRTLPLQRRNRLIFLGRFGEE
ncbi:MAG: hypothetical protein JO081_02905 [Alphaproteobacteria bacterium]|nr:hypothetical protein [Alphaproteobacteria bacterium]